MDILQLLRILVIVLLLIMRFAAWGGGAAMGSLGSGWRFGVGVGVVFGVLCGALSAPVGAQVSPPVASRALADQVVTANGTIDVDVAYGFTGVVDSYSAQSSDEAALSVSVSGSVVSLSGVQTAPAVLVTVTATNTAGSTSQSFIVTIRLPPPPGFAERFVAQALEVGETVSVDVAAGFNGPIDRYTASQATRAGSRFRCRARSCP
jgi:hypothetical protein